MVTVAHPGIRTGTAAPDAAALVPAAHGPATLPAVLAPLLLFAHGIVAWVGGLAGAPPDGVDPLAVAGAVVLVLAVAAWAWLVIVLGERLLTGPVVLGAVVAAAFGAGATGAVALGRAVGLVGTDLPVVLGNGGPLLLAGGVAGLLAATWWAGRLPTGSLATAALGGLALALPLGLVPLGALLLLIGLAPVLGAADPAPAVSTRATAPTA